MNSKYSYTGKELELFSHAANWKKYFAQFILPYLKGSVLEVGPGTGSTTRYLNKSENISSWLLLEPDAEFCQLLESSISRNDLPANCTVRHGNISSIEKSETFDAIIYIDVLEHIENDQEEINRAIEILKEGGVLIVLSPAYNYLYSRFDKSIGHYRRYNKKSLGSVTDNTQIRKIRVRYLDSMSCLLSFMNKLVMKQSYPTRRQIKIWDKLFVPVSRITDKLVFYNFGKSILGVWKKNERIH